MLSNADIARQRLNNQGIEGVLSTLPVDVVSEMGFVQAQDYLGALWAVGLRMSSATEVSVEQALADRSIVRTWPARGTLHFVAAADVRWMLDLLARRPVLKAARRFAQLGLDEETFTKSRKFLVRALQGGNGLARDKIFRALQAENIATTGQRGIHILWRLAQEGLICFGPRQGKQPAFILLDEWLPPAPKVEREESLAKLALRYFTGHGPATLADFIWWSGLAATEAKAGLEMVKDRLIQETYDGRIYWRSESDPAPHTSSKEVHLLPAFDEYLIGYRDRGAVLDALYARRTNNGGGILSPVIVSGGQIIGTWKRTLKRGVVTISADWFNEPSSRSINAFSAAAERYGAFLGLPVKIAEMQPA